MKRKFNINLKITLIDIFIKSSLHIFNIEQFLQGITIEIKNY